ncbi:MAG TPA: DUF4384 domain-containing protein, partial [Candidatus Eisenbacteria bacterium]|nr:DUF4384 domain-containing protein [Candidatus Eisenbacteria bacterium]
MNPNRRIHALLPLLLAGVALLGAAPAYAVTAVPTQSIRQSSRFQIDVWINREEGGVYRPGESMRVFFRSNADAYVLVYNIDTEGYIHLVYPFGPSDPVRVEGGRAYRVPARHDPYDLVADGPAGMEYVVAVASRHPFQDLPWYLSGRDADRDEYDDELDSGQIVGDPYVGIERLNSRIIAPGAEDESDATETYFYIDHRVDYPRYICADCHYSAFGFDPYQSVCSVVDIRIDATWVHYAPVRVGVVRPRYYYHVRSTAPDRYRVWKDRWSSLDGPSTLRSRFTVAPSPKSLRMRNSQGKTPPEFNELRRARPGRLWKGRDEVLRLRDSRGRGGPNVAPGSPDRYRDAPRRDRQEGGRDRSQSQGQDERYQRERQRQEPQEQPRERQRQEPPRERQRQEPQRDQPRPPEDKGQGGGGGRERQRAEFREWRG